MKPKDTVAIGWCHAGEMDTEFGLSIMQLIREFPKLIGSFYCVEGLGLLAKSRNIMVKHFLDNTTDDWLLMLDCDERISPDTFKLLCDTADSLERPVMAGLYFAALWEGLNLRPVPLIFQQDEHGATLPLDNYPKDSVVKITAAGTGALLMHRSALVKLRNAAGEDLHDWAWFQDGPIGGNKWLSEDLMFCARLTEHGVPIHAHTGAVLQHHKRIWVDAPHHANWLEHHQAGSGLDQLK
jgi:hypothetical protein